MKESAGTLLYRHGANGLEVLLVHPSGNYNRRAPWSIPKGLLEAGESLEAAARRETKEETGVVCGDLVPLGEMIYQKSPKRVHGFAGLAGDNIQPRCASWEIDRAEFLAFDTALERIHPDQRVFLLRLAELLNSGDLGKSSRESAGPAAGT